jgi:selenide,water dikinase
VTALNLVFFPACMPAGILSEILSGGQAMLTEAGVCLVGGHTVEDDELKYGLSVTGIIHPDHIVRNSTARPGDQLFLTKPLGFGIVSTAIKADMADTATVEEAVRWMITLNNHAAQLMVECGATACTDVTGFGLLGHAIEMARGAGVGMRINFDAVPLVQGVTALINDGLVPAGCYRNRDHFQQFVQYGARFKGAGDRLLALFDPQTSGGLLIALSPASAERFQSEAALRKLFAVRIGEVTDAGEPIIVVD